MIFKHPIFNHRNIYLFGIFCLAGSIPITKYTTSISEIILLSNWLLEGQFKDKFSTVLKNKCIWMLSSIFIIHLLWLFNTTDFTYASKDLRIKLPILLLPLIIGTSAPLNKKLVTTLFLFYAAAAFSGTIFSLSIYKHMLHVPYHDLRRIFPDMSLIRFSLNLDVAIILLLYIIIFDKSYSINFKIILGFFILWFFAYMIFIQSLTGLIILVLTSVIFFFSHLIKMQSKLIRYLSLLIIVIIPMIVLFIIFRVYHDYYNIKPLNPSSIQKYTANGNVYDPDFSDASTENGNYVWLYICEKEMRKEWNSRSKIAFDNKDSLKNEIKYTLIRYLASKGFTKDSVGISRLSKRDIENIENGCANYIYKEKFGIYTRFYEVLWEFDHYAKFNDVGGHSVTQRIAFVKNAILVIKEHFWWGVGTGDVQLEMNKMYDKTHSRLLKEFRLRAHNQFVTFYLTFGVFGASWIIFTFFYIGFYKKKYKDFLYLTVFIVSMLSFINEDTLESQAGVTFIIFMITFFSCGIEEQD